MIQVTTGGTHIPLGHQVVLTHVVLLRIVAANGNHTARGEHLSKSDFAASTIVEQVHLCCHYVPSAKQSTSGSSLSLKDEPRRLIPRTHRQAAANNNGKGRWIMQCTGNCFTGSRPLKKEGEFR